MTLLDKDSLLHKYNDSLDYLNKYNTRVLEAKYLNITALIRTAPYLRRYSTVPWRRYGMSQEWQTSWNYFN